MAEFVDLFNSAVDSGMLEIAFIMAGLPAGAVAVRAYKKRKKALDAETTSSSQD
jgi:hypothetical protein